MKRWLKRLLRWDARNEYEKSVVLYQWRRRAAQLVGLLPIGLPRLMQLAGTDKHRPDVAGGHRYGPAYAEALRPYRWRAIRLLEIGIGGTPQEVGGRSLLAWLAYFPRATVLACDLQDRTALAGGRLRVRQMNQSDPADLARVAAEGPFDVIVDDGSHLSAHQLMTFRTLFAALKPGGLYVIEDVQTSYWDREVGGVQWDGAAADSVGFRETCVGWFLDLAKSLNHAEFLQPADAAMLAFARDIRRIGFEHNLIFVHKGPNDALSNTVGVD